MFVCLHVFPTTYRIIRTYQHTFCQCVCQPKKAQTSKDQQYFLQSLSGDLMHSYVRITDYLGPTPREIRDCMRLGFACKGQLNCIIITNSSKMFPSIFTSSLIVVLNSVTTGFIYYHGAFLAPFSISKDIFGHLGGFLTGVSLADIHSKVAMPSSAQ